jgi:hypothetical protein
MRERAITLWRNLINVWEVQRKELPSLHLPTPLLNDFGTF